MNLKFILAVPKTMQGKHLAISSTPICWCDSLLSQPSVDLQL